MGRGLLSDEQLASIAEKLPDVLSLQKRALVLCPIGMSAICKVESKFPIAAVCLADAADRLWEVRYALHEYHAHCMYYREIAVPPSPLAAVLYEKYYLDDAAFRLYAAAEDLAEAICCMLELSREELHAHKEGRSSRQNMVGRYLSAKLPEHELTALVRKLVESDNWGKVRVYRDACVHDQPPLVEGQGMSYLRKNRWLIGEGGATLIVNGGDKPELSTQAIYNFMMPALLELREVFSGCLGWYEKAAREPRGGAWHIALTPEDGLAEAET